MRNVVSIRYFAIAVVFGAFCINSACSPSSGPGASSSAPTPQPIVQGTVSGGGGNGCNGAAFEAYSKKIATLEEYRLFIRPLLRRMAEEGSDPLVTYLSWAVDEKAWYFIPCELQKISTDQIGLAVDSDQLARHGEHGIYIHSVDSDPGRDPKLPPLQTYAQKKSKEKAVLLLHEIIMGVRLLMKKSAQEQCAALAKKDAKLCSDPSVMAMAEGKEISAKDAMVMDAQDHEAVRAMTTYLSENGVDLSAAKVRAVRERLGFNFPWSRAVSNVEFDDLRNAIHRSRMLGDRYEPSKEMDSVFKSDAMTCSFPLDSWSAGSTSLSTYMIFVSKLPTTAANAEIAAFDKRHQSASHATICAEAADRVFFQDVSNGDGTTGPFKCESGQYLVSPNGLRAHFQVDRGHFLARGVLRDGVAYDELSFDRVFSRNENPPQIEFQNSRVDSATIKILLTREDSPRLHSVRIEPKQILKRSAGGDAKADDTEMLDVPGVPPLECVRKTAR